MPYKNKEDEREHNRKYYQANKKECNERMREYRQVNREEIRKQRQKYYQENRGELKEKQREYNLVHKEQKHEYNSKYYQAHKKKIIETAEDWNKEHPEGRREIMRKCKSKRYRNLGFNPLNEPFEGCEAHHINTKDVIYIPKEMHRSVWHCLKTGQGMAEINTLAIKFYLKQQRGDE